MTIDKEKLKALAERACPSDPWYKPGDLRYHDDKHGETHGIHHDTDNFIEAANPAAILALLAEIEQLRHSHEQVCTNYNRVSFTSEERGKQVDQLKAENEALRKDAERYRFVRKTWCPDWPAEKADAQIDEAMAKEAANKGHGHVFARPDGVKARCGGPSMCAQCREDQKEKEASHG